ILASRLRLSSRSAWSITTCSSPGAAVSLRVSFWHATGVIALCRQHIRDAQPFLHNQDPQGSTGRLLRGIWAAGSESLLSRRRAPVPWIVPRAILRRRNHVCYVRLPIYRCSGDGLAANDVELCSARCRSGKPPTFLVPPNTPGRCGAGGGTLPV